MGRAVREKWRALRWRVAMFLMPWDDPSADPHEMVEVEGVPLDRGIVGLVRWCWVNGIETYGSCQGAPELWDILQERSAGENPFDAYICVGSVRDALRLAGFIRPFCTTPPRVQFYEDGSDYWFVYFDPRAVSR